MTVYLFDNTKTVIGTVDPLYYKQRMQLNGLISHALTAKYDPKLEAAHYFGSRDVDNENIFWMYRITNALKQGSTIELTGIYLLFDELQGDVVRDIRPTNALASSTLSSILSGSRWQLGVSLTTKRASSNYYYVSKLSAFSDFLNTWGVEFQPRLTWSDGQITGRYIDLYDKLSDDYGKWFEYGDKLLTIAAEQSNDQIYTALIGMGKGEEVGDGFGRKIKFDDVEWSVANGDPVSKPTGQDYVELPDATAQYGFRVNIVDFPDITDKTELLRATYNQLVYQSRPRITFQATAFETGLVELGETVTIIRDDLGIRYKTRVFEIERDFLDKTAKTFILGDKVVSSAAERIIKTERERQDLAQEVESRLQDVRKEIVKSYFDNDGYNYDLRVGNEHELPAGYYSFNRPIDMDPSEVVYMGGGRILIANSKLPDGEWDWRTALDGDGMLADIIHAGKLMGEKAEWNLEDGTFRLGESTDNYGLLWDGQTLSIKGNLYFSSGESLENKVDNLHNQIEDIELTPGPAGEDATTVFIESVNGNIFKNAGLATTLVVTVITGGQQIVSLTQLKSKYGNDARLQWSEKKYGELNFTPLSDGDARLASDNFMLNIAANDVDTKSTFRCDLLT